MENKIKHLEMIEHIIERMAKNSFQLKTWTMTLVAAIFALSSKDANKQALVFVFIPTIGFWLLVSLEPIRHLSNICNADCNRIESQVFHESQIPDECMESNHLKYQGSCK